MDAIILNAPQSQFARKAYFWREVNYLRNQTGLPIHVGYRSYNAAQLEAEYRRLKRRQVQQNVAIQATEALKNRSQRILKTTRKKILKEVVEVAKKRIINNDIKQFFLKPIADAELDISNIPIEEIISHITLNPRFILLFNAGDRYFTITQDRMLELTNMLNDGGYAIDILQTQGSDAEVYHDFINFDGLKKFIWRSSGRQRHTGGYFK